MNVIEKEWAEIDEINDEFNLEEGYTSEDLEIIDILRLKRLERT